MEYLAIVTALILIEYLFFGLLVAKARTKTGVKAPAISGHPDFERCFRIQQNTLEQLIITIPSLWIFGHFISPLLASACGVLFIVGRAMYCRGYLQDADKRTAGFMVGQLGQMILLIGALLGPIIHLLGSTSLLGSTP